MKRARITEELAYGTALDRLTGGERPAGPPEPVADDEAGMSAPPASEAPRSAMIKLSVFLNHEEDAYLEGLASTAKFSGGRKLSKTKLIEAMVRAMRTTELDVRGVRDDAELLRRVVAQLRK